jgi:hypothetical protein
MDNPYNSTAHRNTFYLVEMLGELFGELLTRKKLDSLYCLVPLLDELGNEVMPTYGGDDS